MTHEGIVPTGAWQGHPRKAGAPSAVCRDGVARVVVGHTRSQHFTRTEQPGADGIAYTGALRNLHKRDSRRATRMTRTRNVIVGGALVTLLAVLGIGQILLERSASAQAKGAVQAPRFEVDPMWPKPLPN